MNRHYDIDAAERNIRAMYAEASKQPFPPSATKDGIECSQWQNRAENVVVEFVKLSLTMENEMVPDHKAAYYLGVILADQASNFIMAFKPGHTVSPMAALMSGFTNQMNLAMQSHNGDGQPNGSCAIPTMPTGNA